jgi:hypothetical protein
LPRIEHVGVLILDIRFFDCRAGRMLACPERSPMNPANPLLGWFGTEAAA